MVEKLFFVLILENRRRTETKIISCAGCQTSFELLGQEVKFAADPEVVGPNAKAAVAEMKDGDVILLENTRYRAEETKNGDEFSKELASLLRCIRK